MFTLSSVHFLVWFSLAPIEGVYRGQFLRFILHYEVHLSWIVEWLISVAVHLNSKG